ncbi:MAG TPA: CRISPR-associated helicase/endonuclease Cas3 [Clostridiales bacterium]|nr:CRISPR-associated helicase/endonuclease Cas3 [Clostridiales bacterium]
MLLAHGATDEHPEGQSIEAHLKGTGELAETFAAEFGAAANGKLCGLAHDIGKYSDEFQLRLRGGKKVDHATAGAIECFKIKAAFEAVCVIGHHSGLPNVGHKDADTTESQTFFGRKLRAEQGGIPDYRKNWNGHIALPQDYFRPSGRGFATAFYIRMLYSCLVDADYIDTETFMNGDAGRGNYEPLSALCDKLTAYISKWNNPTREIDILRQKILNSCIEKASAPRGIFSLTVPTGGGKTVASMAFALNHAVANSMKRIIYVIPYTSIIEQNAKVFRDILGQENVVEHHSSVSYELSENADELEYRSALATENWDAPVIVTTAVQFFESLYANRSSKCRKLHNIANSVIIFDEAQMIPSNNLRPCVAAIAELVRAYNATAVLCTATQPAIDEMLLEYSKKESVVELCPDVDGMFEKFRRTSFEKEGRLTTDELVSRLESQQQVLCIVNTRKFAQEVYEALPSEGRFHLSTLMCPVHRKQKLDEIRERLKSGKTCRVVSTSLIEAGVDVDFPRVFREMAGLDSILQAAGRCNREGKRSAESSIVTVFESENKVNKLIAVNRDAAEETVRDWTQPNTTSTIERYFKAYRDFLRNDDKSGVITASEKGISGCGLPFEWIAKEFKLIDQNTFTVYISVGEGKELISRLREGERSRELYRKAGMYSVSIYENHFNALINAGAAEPFGDDAAILTDLSLYSDEKGLATDVPDGSALFN